MQVQQKHKHTSTQAHNGRTVVMAFTLYLEKLATTTDRNEINNLIFDVSCSYDITKTEYQILRDIARDKCR